MKTLLVIGIIACMCAMHATALPRPAADPDISDAEDKMDAEESLVTSETRFGRRRWGGHGGGFGGGFGGGHGGGLGGGFGGGLGGGFGGGGGLGGGFGGGGGGGFGGGFGGGWGR